ncbi:hypothetical protein QBC43DRAFT_70053 [Cladorrhinum sp. PSN259]|nr:hypothetical protein QBC43DRAFT_70053 [Cladorrhinum sp. PSN259]
MAQEEKRPRVVPPVPSSLNPHTWEMVDLDTPQNRSAPPLQPHAHTDPSITPYLGLRARLSQLWFNRWTVLLLLILARVLILASSLDENIADAKKTALSACTKVQDIGSAMASMPHYLSVGVNRLVAERTTAEISSQVDLISDMLTIAENIIVFFIEFYYSTLICLVLSLAHTGIDVSTQVLDSAGKDVEDQIKKITGQIGEGLKDINTVLEKARSSFVGGVIDIPTVDLTKQITALEGIQITDVLSNELQSLNKTIPSFDKSINLTRNAISIPFDFIRGRLNTNAGSNTTFLGNTTFPIAKKQVLEFCDNNEPLEDFFGALFAVVSKAKTAFLITIPILAVLAVLVFGYIEIRRWRREKQRARIFTEHGYDPMDVVYIASRPMTANAGIRLSSWFSGKKKVLARWFVAYGSSYPALFVLSLALAGLLACLCQLILLKVIQKEIPNLTNRVGDFAQDVVRSLEATSNDWADTANAGVLNTQNTINDNVFGLIKNATVAVNNTLNLFEDEVEKGINAAFKGGMLEAIARDLVGCIITRRIENFEKGLAWVNERAHITLPQFQKDIFSAGANESIQGDGQLTSFLSTDPNVKSDDITSAVDHVANSLRNGIMQEVIISLVLLLVYIIIVLIGMVSALLQNAKRDSTRGVGGERYGMRQGTDKLAMRDPSNGFSSFDRRDAYQQEVVNAGTVRRGPEIRFNSHARKSSYPEVEDSGR